VGGLLWVVPVAPAWFPAPSWVLNTTPSAIARTAANAPPNAAARLTGNLPEFAVVTPLPVAGALAVHAGTAVNL
jgi:hypothetical protein